MTKKRRVNIRHRSSRVVLSEILPYEVPVTFSNFGFYQFLNDSRMRVTDSAITFHSTRHDLSPVLKIIFGADAHIQQDTGPHGHTFSLKIDAINRPTVPFHFKIRHSEDRSRQLSIAHPLSQISLVRFYQTYSSLLLYHTSRSPFSVRHPDRVARYTIVRDSVFQERRDRQPGRIEAAGREYDRIRSYFVYRKYDNIHKFYESDEYRHNEKRFGHLLRLDIANCFDSVYTHSITWATSDKETVKRARFVTKRPRSSKPTFADEFDQVMMRLNDSETHGLPIGPEVSRIFAEVILQRVDMEVERALGAREILRGRDYEVLRYVDDYFIFMRDLALRDAIANELQEQLLPYRFHLNPSKETIHSTPFISDMSIGKSRLAEAFEDELRLRTVSPQGEVCEAQLEYASSPRRLIAAYKTVLREVSLGPLDIGNFALAMVERRLESMMERYFVVGKASSGISDMELKGHLLVRNQKTMSRALTSAVELAFYIFGGCPRVASSIKLARIVSLCRAFVSEASFVGDMREALDDLIFGEVLIQLNRNPLAEFASIESLYLLTLLRELGEHYGIDVGDLCRFVGISRRARGSYVIPRWYNALIVSELFRFAGAHPEYADLRAELERFMLERVEEMHHSGRFFAEQPIYVLNAIASPHVSDEVKCSLLGLYGLDTPQLRDAAIKLQDRWFTDWQDSDLHADLQLKRVQEVY